MPTSTGRRRRRPPILDWPSRLLLAVSAGLVGFALGGLAIKGFPSPDVVTMAPSPAPTSIDQPAGPTGSTAPRPTPTRTPVDDATPTATPTASPSATATPAPQVTIAFTGDVHGEPPIDRVLADGENPLAGVADILSAADVAVVNLETAVGSVGSPADKTFTFQADPALLQAVAEAGVDVVSLANNHGLDFGHDAAVETVDLARQAGLAVVGYGRNADSAYAAEVIDVDGRTVAVLGLSRVLPTLSWAATGDRPGMASAYDIGPAAAAVRAAAQRADHVVVTIHWGRERWICPDGEQLALARALVEAGADVIAGHHPHVLQGVVDLDGAVVAYSLGNFVFYARTPATRQTGVLTVTLGDGGVVGQRWHPAVIDGSGSPQPVATQAPIPRGETLTATSSGPECGPPG